MTIYVKMEFNENKTITLKVEASDTIKHIKGIIKNLADSKSRKWIDPDWGPGAKPGDKDGAHAFYFEKNPNKVRLGSRQTYP